jgi:hypothetical protein
VDILKLVITFADQARSLLLACAVWACMVKRVNLRADEKHTRSECCNGRQTRKV